jgi:hypothetical protein
VGLLLPYRLSGTVFVGRKTKAGSKRSQTLRPAATKTGRSDQPKGIAKEKEGYLNDLFK